MIVPPAGGLFRGFLGRFTLTILVLCGLGVASGTAGQFSSGVNLVEVYATVTDARGEPIQGLTAADFVVEEDGERQTIGAFAAGEFPLAVAIAVDTSFSVPRERLRMAATATRGFIDALRPSDMVMVLAVGSEVETVAPLSSDHHAARSAVERLEPWGTTPLYDAILAAIDAIQPAAGRRALIVLSDGNDRYSRASEAEVVEQARRKDVLVYPIALGRRPAIFIELATVTGGRSFQVTGVQTLQTTLASIALELRHQYLLGYTPARSAEGGPRWRSIQVTVDRPNARVRARDGYVAR